MKKFTSIVIVAILLLAVFSIASCGKIELTVTDNTEKAMTIVAEKAKKGAFFTVGTLVVEKGEELEITSELETGSIELGFVNSDGMDDVNEVPDLSDRSQLPVVVSGKTTQRCQAEEGSYLLKAEVKQKATGSVRIEVQATKKAKSTKD